MRVPIATYRMQLNKNFTFGDLKAVLPYLRELGISHIYASPVFQAKKGSLHGYDVTDPNTISEELGGRVGFEEVLHDAQILGLSWLQDIVPNHASYAPENPRIYDVLSKGAGSSYACFFDVYWNHRSSKLFGKLMAPFLSESYRRSLKSGQIRLIYGGRFKIKVGELEFPVNVATQQHLELDGDIEQILEKYNSRPDFLDAIIVKQYYRLAHWRTALSHINYRRFFDILDLIGVRLENPAAFEQMQQLIFELAQSGSFSALRIDHIDGLYEPAAYLEGMRVRLPTTYIVVEKILTGEEQLPCFWPVQGTTGYDFANYVNKLQVQIGNEPTFNGIYQSFTGNTRAFEELLYATKKSVVETYFLGDMRNLTRLFENALLNLEYEGSWNGRGLFGALVELMACFPVYRSYIDEQQFEDDAFREALRLAHQCSPMLAEGYSAVDFLLNARRSSPDALDALMRFQQYSGALMAKGFEDTALYRYTRLLSLNDVGSNPDEFGITAEKFHRFNRSRIENWPLTLNATSTHDTKRGEDVRARLNLLSEVPEQFQANILRWRELNAAKKKSVRDEAAPDTNIEYYLYQTLLGAYPWSSNEQQDFVVRIGKHLVKALREAKVHTSWLSPNLIYESVVADFAAELLGSADFLNAFLPFQQTVAFFGALNSLSQTLLKITCPGVPDFYQGTELWNLSLVDPDNRRPVDFPLRQRLLSEIKQLKSARVSELQSDLSNGKVKLYIINKALHFRSQQKQLFEQGEYLPLVVKGKRAEHVVAFCRRKGAVCAIVVVPRFPTALLQTTFVWGKGSVDWADTCIELPQGVSKGLTDIFTDKNTPTHSGQLHLSDILEALPVAVLWGIDNG